MPATLAAERLAAQTVQIRVRRYLCVECGRTMTVVPREVRPHAEILVSTVVVALGLWAYHPDSPPSQIVRDWVLRPDEASPPGWRQLRRWASSAELDGATHVDVRVPPKRRAARIIQILAGRSPPETRGDSLTKRALEAVFGQADRGE